MNDVVDVAGGGASLRIRLLRSGQTGFEERTQPGEFEIGGKIAFFHTPANAGGIEASHARIEHDAPKVAAPESRDDFGVHFAREDGF